jgi:hypothetical protein
VNNDCHSELLAALLPKPKQDAALVGQHCFDLRHWSAIEDRAHEPNFTSCKLAAYQLLNCYIELCKHKALLEV